MNNDISQQPQFDAIASDPFSGADQVDLTAAGAAIDANPAAAAAFGGGFSLRSVPWYVWAILAGAILYRVVR